MLLLAIALLSGFIAIPFTSKRLPSVGALLALGLSWFAVVGFFTSLLGHGTFPALLLTPVLVLSFKGVRNARREGWLFRPQSLSIPTHPSRRIPVLLFLLLIVFSLFVYYRQAGYPILSYDVLSYHLPLARDFLTGESAKSALLSPSIFYGKMPLAVPMIESFFVGASWGGVPGMGLHLLLGLMMFAGASSAARCAAWLGARHSGRLLAATLWLYHPLLLKTHLNALAEPLIALMAVASLEMLLVGFSKKGHRLHFLHAGTLAGTAMAMKLSAAGTIVLPMGVLALLYGFRNHLFGPWQVIRPAVYTALGGTLAMLPWFGRGIYLGGHPFFPFRGSSPDWSGEQAAFVVNQHSPQTPLSLSYWSDFLLKNDLYGYQVLGLSLLLVAVTVAIVVGKKRHQLPIAAVGLIGYGFYLLVGDNPDRFLVGSIAFLIPVAASVYTPRRSSFPSPGAAVVVAILMVATVWPQLRPAMQSPGVYKAEERALFLGASEEEMRIIQIGTEKSDAENGRLLLLFEARAGMFPGTVDFNTVWDTPPWAGLLREAKSPREFHSALLNEGYNGIFVNETEWGRLVDFYGEQWKPDEAAAWGQTGFRAPIDRDRKLAYLKAFPPFQFARFEERDLTILLDFLITLRNNTIIAAPTGPESETWLATLPSEAY